ncbi:KICSTOR subunit 2-like isoform X2 [Artemia franciscana]|uniref:KICSTOR subunit 2-like isoform X2 n=1 Tax=Artemia franciscana TaxID=6661 RepID=UPI0032D9BE45
MTSKEKDKSTLKTTYETLRDDFRRIDGLHNDGSFLSHLSGQLSHFCAARVDLLEFYDKLAGIASSKSGAKVEDLLPVISDICETNVSKFYHPILTQVKAVFSLETEALQKLLRAHLDIQKWQFYPSVIALQEAKVKLDEWNLMIQGRETRKLFFSKPQPICPNLQWLNRWKSTLVAKFSLYFYNVLLENSSVSEMRVLCGRHSIDYIYMIHSFQKKYEASCVALIYDLTEVRDFPGLGYRLPIWRKEEIDVLETNPLIFYYPEKPDISQLDILNSGLASKPSSSMSYDRIIPLSDNKNSYFFIRVDPKIVLVVIFHGRKSEKDNFVSSFMFDLSSQLRCTKIFSSLRGFK